MVVTMSEDHLTPSANPPVDVTSWTQATDPRDRSRAGIATRTKAPLDAHAIWKVKEGRREAISLLEEQSAIRVPDLIPLRYKRMSASPFTFYRGTVLIMTNDLASTPVTGIPVQCVGDAHAVDEFQPAADGHFDICEHKVRRTPLHSLQRGLSIGVAARKLKALGRPVHHFFQRGPHQDLVVHDYCAQHGNPPSRPLPAGSVIEIQVPRPGALSTHRP